MRIKNLDSRGIEWVTYVSVNTGAAIVLEYEIEYEIDLMYRYEEIIIMVSGFGLN